VSGRGQVKLAKCVPQGVVSVYMYVCICDEDREREGKWGRWLTSVLLL